MRALRILAVGELEGSQRRLRRGPERDHKPADLGSPDGLPGPIIRFLRSRSHTVRGHGVRLKFWWRPKHWHLRLCCVRHTVLPDHGRRISDRVDRFVARLLPGQ